MTVDAIAQPTDRPLCVDLDGTLIRTDSLIELGGVLLKTRFLQAIRTPFWALRGRAYLKRKMSENASLEPALLPYDETLLGVLRTARAAGRRIVLCTAADEIVARAVAAHLGIFDEVMASDGTVNLSGNNKRDALVGSFGAGGYDYVGNDTPDLPAFSQAHCAWLASPTPALSRQARALGVGQVLVPRRAPTPRDFLTQLRLHQWLKNILLFLPLLAAHRLTDASAFASGALAFFAFSLCASGVYVLNDLMDLPADRRHPRKRHRPLASGRIPAETGLVLTVALPLASFALAMFLPWQFLAWLATYYMVSLHYNIWAKNIAVLDTLVLAGLYTLRIIAGAAAVAVHPSFWLLAFSMFFFLSVAMAKRYSELITLDLDDHQAIPGRQYRRVDLSTLISQGTASGYAAVTVLALYINSEEIRASYSRPEVIWLICPLMIYWINKVWLNTQRREMRDDPLIWAIENRVSRAIGVLCALLLLIAI